MTTIQFISDFLPNLLATFIGALVGIPIALMLDRRQESGRAQASNQKMLTLLRAELDQNAKQVENWQNSADRSRGTGVLAAVLKNELWRAFSDGGELSWLKDLEILSAISNAYYCIRTLSDLAEKHFNSIQFLTRGNSAALGNEILMLMADKAVDARNAIMDAINKIDAWS